MSDLTASQERELVALVKNFGASFLNAQKDWATFKAGVVAGLFSNTQRNTVIAWFRDFPKFWETIKLNFQSPVWITAPGSGTATRQADLTVSDTGFSLQVDLWVSKLRGDTGLSGLGLLPLIVIAGIIIASLLGAAGAIWAIGYWKQQANISKMIEGVTAGKIPAAVLQTAIAQETDTGIFGNVTGLLKWAVIAGVLVFALPIVRDLLGAKKG